MLHVPCYVLKYRSDFLYSLVRKETILLNMLHIRMLIKSNVVILVDALGTTDSELLQAFQRELSVSLPSQSES